jgi:UDP-N-acetylglucosamine--dolichyl-phosphate N-acetylglucosaminephosphotransferase
MVVCLFAFLFYNFYPARVFPGDVLTYPVGGMIAIMAILGDFEQVAVFFFIPYILEVFLKLRGRLVKQSFGKPNKDGSLGLRYDKIYGLEHLAIRILNKIGIKATEKRVVYLIWSFQILIIILGFIIFRDGIF